MASGAEADKAGSVIRAVTDRAHKAAAVTDFVQRALVSGTLDVTQLEAMARAAGLLGKRQQIQHAKAFKKAKKSLGIRSVRAGFGSLGKWAWLLAPKPTKPALNETYREDGAVIYKHACALGCEGIVSKRLGYPYRAGRSNQWLKVKNPAAPAVRRLKDEDWR